MIPGRSYSSVRLWRHEPLYDIEMRVRAKASALDAIADVFGTANTVNDWDGAAAKAATRAYTEGAARARSLVRTLNQARDAFIHANEGVRDLVRMVAEAEAVAAANEFVINNDGSVTDRGPRTPVPGGDAEDVNRELARKRAELTEQVRQLLVRATEIDEALVEELRTATVVHRYQADEDPKGVTSYFRMAVTAKEAEMLGKLSVADKREFLAIYLQAFSVDDEGKKYLWEEVNNDGRGDAFRHAYWNAMLTERFGAEWTEKYTTAHEGLPDNPPETEAMDLHNNQVGRDIALRYPGATDKQLQTLVRLAIERGDMMIVHNQTLYPSDSPPARNG
jgi:hypothetical protein